MSTLLLNTLSILVRDPFIFKTTQTIYSQNNYYNKVVYWKLNKIYNDQIGTSCLHILNES